MGDDHWCRGLLLGERNRLCIRIYFLIYIIDLLTLLAVVPKIRLRQRHQSNELASVSETLRCMASRVNELKQRVYVQDTTS
jgi:cytochrome c-type biogenesis protein CcmH/NrfF